MRIAYLLNWELGSQDGVSKKVYSQSRIWLSKGHEVKVFCIAKDAIAGFGEIPLLVVKKEPSANILQEYASVYKAYKAILPHLIEFKADVIYFRFDIYQPALNPIFRQFPTVMEVNTNDIEELKLISRQNFKGKIRYCYHLLVRNTYFSKMSGFCCVTNEIAGLSSIRRFKKPVFVIPNSLDSREYGWTAVEQDAESSIPRLVFMGSPRQAWHGLDKVMELAQKTIGVLEFDIIGTNGAEFSEKPANVVFHGYLKKEQYQQVVCRADVGICTLALHRNNMQEASPLKTREYLAYGLPIILGYEDTAFKGSALPDWAFQLPNNEANVSNHVEEIVQFCYQNKNRKLSGKDTHKYIDSSAFEGKRLNYLAGIASCG